MARQITVAEFLDQALAISGKTQREIAAEVGWAKPNVISMMKQGLTKVPLDKVPALAKACGVDPAVFVRIAMNEYMPEVWRVVREYGGEPLSKEELALVQKFRLETEVREDA